MDDIAGDIITKYYDAYDVDDKCEKYGSILQALSA